MVLVFGVGQIQLNHRHISLIMEATIYHNPKCGTSRNVMKILKENNVDITVIEYLKESGVDAERKLDAPGVYVDNQKIAALGLRVKKHRTYHGLALNVDMDLMPFKGINPCGIKGMVSTQLIDFKRDITLNEVKQGLSKYLLRYLDQISTIISDVA